jgi:hypothetical protein
MSDDVRATGPVFDGRAAEAARDYARDLQQKLAEKTRDRVVERMGSEFKHNSGKYASSIHVETGDANSYVRDRYEFVYGPWLEGTGSRNETTRFRGYHTMRIVATEMDAQSKSTADEEIKPYLERMN